MRLRTLPVSTSGVVIGAAYGLMGRCFSWGAVLISLLFAILAQIASNFANEYFDFKDGLDRPGREGPRRGVTEGDIAPEAMKKAFIATLAAACVAGVALIWWGGWWLMLMGILIAAGVFAYSAGPYPLSRHGLGEIAVVFFFGIIPVNLVYYLQAANVGSWSEWYPGNYFDLTVFIGSIAIGLMGANVLIVNNYRDMEDDKLVNKRTLAVVWGRQAVSYLYLFNGFVAVALMSVAWLVLPAVWLLVPVAYLCLHTFAWLRMLTKRGQALNPFLGITSLLMLFYSIGFLLANII